MLLVTERFKVLHVGDVIVKLRFGAHTGEYGEDVIETCAEADSPRRDGKLRILCLHDALNFVVHACEGTALDRLHNDDGFIVLDGDLVALSGLHVIVFPVDVVELELYEFGFRVLGERFVEHFRAVVERESAVLDFALCFHLEKEVPRADAVGFLELRFVHGVQQVVIEILDTCAFHRFIENALHVGFRLYVVPKGQLCSEREAVTRVALHNGFARCDFTFTVDVYVCGVKIRKALCHESIDHGFRLLHIDLVADHRQTHETETELWGRIAKITSVHFEFLPRIVVPFRTTH